jgi:hypothetical protein
MSWAQIVSPSPTAGKEAWWRPYARLELSYVRAVGTTWSRIARVLYTSIFYLIVYRRSQFCFTISETDLRREAMLKSEEGNSPLVYVRFGPGP